MKRIIFAQVLTTNGTTEFWGLYDENGNPVSVETAGNGRTLAPAPQTWVYPLSGKSVPGHAQAGDVPAAKGQSSLQGKAIRTDAVSRPARSGRCEGGADEMPNKPGRTAIPVYGDRRIYTPSLSGRISRTKHLLLR